MIARNEKRRVIDKMKIGKKILVSVFIIGLVAFGLGYGTYSYFSDTAQSTDNILTAATYDIKLWGSSWEDTVSGTWSISNWAPGQNHRISLLQNQEKS